MSLHLRMPIEDFWSDRVPVREDGHVLRPMHMMRVKTPAQSKSTHGIFTITGGIPVSDAWRPLSRSACPFIRAQR